jgi:cytochrome P450
MAPCSPSSLLVVVVLKFAILRLYTTYFPDDWTSYDQPRTIVRNSLPRPDCDQDLPSAELLEVYGPCISTADLKNWPRHRKALAAPFNESIMKFVWNESLDQARQMLSSWTTAAAVSEGIYSVAQDTRTLSLNVLAATGFRRSFAFKSASKEQKTSSDTASSYRDALSTVLDNVVLLMLVPRRYLLLSIVPKALQRIGKAADEFQHHMEQMFDEETTAFSEGKQGTGGLMTSLVRATTMHETKPTGAQPQGLSVEEVYGNIFVINFAGHDTTANTLAFTMYLLATEPEVQDWVHEELSSIISGNNNWDYAHLSPRLLRCRAVLVRKSHPTAGIC